MTEYLFVSAGAIAVDNISGGKRMSIEAVL
jgi:hypothetical protein